MAETLTDRINQIMDKEGMDNIDREDLEQKERGLQESSSGTRPPAEKTAQKPKKTLPKSLIFVLAPIIIVGIITLIVSPKLAVNKYLSNIEGPAKDTRESLSKVNDSLSRILNIITGEESKEIRIGNSMDLTKAAYKLKDVLDEQGKVAGLSIGQNYNVYDEFSNRAKRIRALMNNFTKTTFSEYGEYEPDSQENMELTTIEDSGTGEVAGSEDIEGPLISGLRELKEVSKNGQDNVSSSQVNLEFLKNSLKDELPNDLRPVYKKLDLLVADTDNYLSESKKTVDYYEMITGISIELVPAVASINALILDLSETSQPQLYLDKIAELEDTIIDLKNIVSSYSAFDIPKGLENLHNDNIAVMELIDKTIKGIKQAVIENNAAAFADVVTKFGIDLEVISTRATVYEISFWQGSRLFKNHRALDDQYGEIAEQISELKEKNKIPLITQR